MKEIQKKYKCHYYDTWVLIAVSYSSVACKHIVVDPDYDIDALFSRLLNPGTIEKEVFESLEDRLVNPLITEFNTATAPDVLGDPYLLR